MTVPTPTYTDGDWGYDLTTVDGTQKAIIVSYSGEGDKVLTFPSEVGGYEVYQVGKSGQNETIIPALPPVFKGIVIPATCKRVGAYAFFDSNGSQIGAKVSGHIQLPEGLLEIGECAFRGLQYITEAIEIPDSVTTIGKYAFRYLTRVKHIMIGKGVTSIGTGAFYQCYGASEIVFQSETAPTIASGSEGAFALGTSVNKVNIPVRSFNNWATILDNYKNAYTTFTYIPLDEIYKKMLYAGNKVQVESAIRDEEGVRFLTNYAKKDEIGDGIITINTQGGTTLGTFSANQSTNQTVTLPNGSVQLPNQSVTFVSDNTYEEFPYRASVSVSGITSSTYAEVTYSEEQATSLNFATFCDTGTDVIYLYSRTNVGTVQIPTISIGMDYSDIVIDSAPISGSQNAISSGAVYTALGNKVDKLSTKPTAGTYTKLTINTEGQVTGGTNPTTLAGYGITDAVQSNNAIAGATKCKITYDSKGLVTAGADLQASDIPSLDWSKITSGKPTTLSGYGITDAKIVNGTITLGSNTITPLTSHQSLANYVTLNSNQTITATKIITPGTALYLKTGQKISSVTSSASYQIIDLIDSNNTRIGVLGSVIFPNPNGSSSIERGAYIQAGNQASLQCLTNGSIGWSQTTYRAFNQANIGDIVAIGHIPAIFSSRVYVVQFRDSASTQDTSSWGRVNFIYADTNAPSDVLTITPNHTVNIKKRSLVVAYAQLYGNDCSFGVSLCINEVRTQDVIGNPTGSKVSKIDIANANTSVYCDMYGRFVNPQNYNQACTMQLFVMPLD